MRDPFILLDDAREARAGPRPAPARLYRDAVEVFAARRAAEVETALAAAEAARLKGAHVAGQVAYEAGLALEPRLRPLLGEDAQAEPLVWLAAFDRCEALEPDAVPRWLAEHADPGDGPATLSPMKPAIEHAAYDAAFATLAEAIAAGDVYQANLTFPLAGRWQGDPLALYAAIRGRAAAGYGGVVWDGERWSLSFSPELFFSLRQGEIVMRPMKGTRPRGETPDADATLARDLAHSTKDRAENLMITDLMRNDVSRVAAPGSVRVEAPFAIETYPTVHQMVTTVRAKLAQGTGATDLLRAIFPCGSITGAPKIRAMELIDAVESSPRGIYCGAIGRLDPDGDAAFNVAIRTLRLTPDLPCLCGGKAVLGVGSAVVADSTAEAEWQECLVKGRFVADTASAGMSSPLRLIETMAFDPDVGLPLIEFHLKRLKASAADLGFSCDRHALRNDIQAFCFLNREAARLRVLCDADGTWTIEGSEMPGPLPDPAPVALVPLPVPPEDWRLRHKTTDRAFYEKARAEAEARNAVEALLVRDDGKLTEGSFTNLFVRRNGMLLTPPAELGLLPGVLRASLIAEGKAKEAELTVSDLADGFLLGNALRGLIRARLVK